MRWIVVAALALAAPSLGAQDPPRKLKLNEIQVLGSHNSYHKVPPARAYEFLQDVDKMLETKWAKGADQSHLPLADQLDKQNIRQLEFDVYWDPRGGLYSKPTGVNMPDLGPLADMVDGTRKVINKIKEGVEDAVEKVKDFFSNNKDRRAAPLDEPGFKVMHLNDFDYNTHCETLKGCLTLVRDWSVKNPRHLPLAILLEPKDLQLNKELKEELTKGVYDFLVGIKVLPIAEPPVIGKPELYALEGEVLSVFNRSQIVTPDDVRGDAATLEQAVLAGKWPYLDDMLGKVYFVLESKRSVYIEDSPILANRLFFTAESAPGQPDAAFIAVYNATSPNITDMVKSGYIVQTRADTVELTDSVGWSSAATASGAQYVATNYPSPQGADQNINKAPYSVSLPPSCNPVLMAGVPCPLLQNGAWEEWQPWGKCDGACGSNGTTTRTRQCAAPWPANGGTPCVGNATETAPCVAEACPAPAPVVDKAVLSSNSAQTGESSSNTGLIVGLAVGLPLLLLLAALLAFFLYRRRRTGKVVMEHECGGAGCRFCTGANCPYVAPPPYQGDSVQPPGYDAAVGKKGLKVEKKGKAEQPIYAEQTMAAVSVEVDDGSSTNSASNVPAGRGNASC